MTRLYGSSLAETKLSCIKKTELKRRIMTESLWNTRARCRSYQSSVEAFVQSGEEGKGTCTERTVGFYCDGLKNTGWPKKVSHYQTIKISY